jgi:hypothetical protein
LREQHAIATEIGDAITQSVGAEGLDEDELNAELEDLQQQELDSKMLGTGNVPIHDKVSLPEAPTTRKSISILVLYQILTWFKSKERHLQWRKTKRRQSFESFKQKWLSRGILFAIPSELYIYHHHAQAFGNLLNAMNQNVVPFMSEINYSIDWYLASWFPS